MHDIGPSIFAASWPGGEYADVQPQIAAVRAELRGWTVVEGSGWLIAASLADRIHSTGDWIVAAPVDRFIDRRSRRLLGISELAEGLNRFGPKLIEDLAPPFRLIVVNRTRNEVSAFFDKFGLGHIFSGELGDVTLIGSSVKLVARISGSQPDPAALIGYSQLGVFPFAATPYAGVRKLLPDDCWATSYISSNPDTPLRDLQCEVRESFRDAVQAMLAAAPDASLELSGGLDSRLILAAMSKDQRNGRVALTLCSPGDNAPDVEIARQLATKYRLEHRISEADFSLWDDPQWLCDTLEAASSGYHGMGNPVDKAILLSNGEDWEGLVRFGGQNGEILRGFYHAMQPVGSQTSIGLWSRLLDWRLVANDRVPPRLFSSPVLAEMLPAFRTRILAELAQFDGEWGQAIDRLYLRLRMQAWVGNAASSSLVRRTMLMPFFDEQFVQAALALPASSRSNSQAAYRLLSDLDPELAMIPLDSGIVPSDMLNHGLRSVFRNRRNSVRKFLTKARQRLRPRAGHAIGSATIVEAWFRQRGFERLDMAKLDSLGIFDPESLDSLQHGRIKPDRNELGFLLVCQSL